MSLFSINMTPFACPACHKIIPATPFRNLHRGADKSAEAQLDCPHCGRAITVSEIKTAVEVQKAIRTMAQSSRRSSASDFDASLTNVISKHRELRRWMILLIIAIITYGICTFMNPAIQTDIYKYAFLPAAAWLALLIWICHLSHLLYPSRTAYVLIIFSLIAITLPVVVYLIDKKALEYLRERGIKTGWLGARKQ